MMGFVEIINPDNNEVILLKDGRREHYQRVFCDGHGLYRSPLGGRYHTIPNWDRLWLCAECVEEFIERPKKAKGELL